MRAITPGVFVGTVARVGESTGCALPVGLEVWKLRLSRPGGYSGTVQDFYFGPSGNCDLAARKAVWELGSTLAMCVVGETWLTGAEACVGYAKLVRAKKDVTPPRVRALPGTGRYGEKGLLRARLSDDSGWARANVRLYDGSTLIGWTDDKEFRRYPENKEYGWG